MRLIATILLFAFTSCALADGYERERRTQMQRQVAAVEAMADGGAVIINEDSDDPAAIPPNPSAPAPSAQCRYGWSVTGGAAPFGAGITASEWDEICGLWMAAQQTTGEARREAAAAAFCLTMKKAKVKSPTCEDWHEGQGVLAVEFDKSNPGSVRFGGVGSGGWN